MAEAAKDQDQSMEEILQSIKRIIAEEGDPVPPANTDVLELTEMLAEDGSVTHTEPPEPAAPESISLDEIMAAPAPMQAAMPEAQPAPMAEAAPIAPAAAMPMPDGDSLLSDATREASAAALSALKHPPAAAAAPLGNLSFRSGTTVEDLVLEALKPMLREWLDLHLTGIVERLVEREVRRLGGQ